MKEILTTAFPVPGENFVDRTGTVRGVTDVTVTGCVIRVDYIEGESESYAPVSSPVGGQ